MTSNPERVPEFQRLLKLYGIDVRHAHPFGYRDLTHGMCDASASFLLAARVVKVRRRLWEWFMDSLGSVFSTQVTPLARTGAWLRNC